MATPSLGAPRASHWPPLQLLACLIHLTPLRRSVDARHLLHRHNTRHAVERSGVVDGERLRQPGESYVTAKLARVADCHGHQCSSQLGGGGDTSHAKAVVRGGGHEPVRSAAKSRPSVVRRRAELCAVRRARPTESVLGAQGAEELPWLSAESLPRVCHCGARAGGAFLPGHL